MIFVNFVLNNSVPTIVSPIFLGALFCAFKKPDLGLRPIAVDLKLRRLIAKIVCLKIRDNLGNFFRPFQLGFGTKNGSEAIAHAIRRYISFPHTIEKLLIKLDYSNAFNMINRNTILLRAKEHIPQFYNFIAQCYKNPSYLSFGDKIILSQRGVQQEDPLVKAAVKVGGGKLSG